MNIMDEVLVKQIREVYPNMSEFMIKLALDYAEHHSEEELQALLDTETTPTRTILQKELNWSEVFSE